MKCLALCFPIGAGSSKIPSSSVEHEREGTLDISSASLFPTEAGTLMPCNLCPLGFSLRGCPWEELKGALEGRTEAQTRNSSG